ncbi:hypothetical protein [Flavobacterium oreochromis]|uniref:Tripartite tricarboxylate transporter TctB family protein n=1 Tax=Flavobacterium oreochromis TaxID=2906078 RepID=A0ABW8P893_9FLAO|nr:hypothetical protein [Flavobacterium oreochromis]
MKIKENFSIFVLILFSLAMFVGIGVLCWHEIKNSHYEAYVFPLWISIILFGGYCLLVLNANKRLHREDPSRFEINYFPYLNASLINETYLLFLLLVPLAVIALSAVSYLLVFFLRNWYYVLMVYLSLSCIIVLFLDKKVYVKILAPIVLVLIMYFGFQVRHIFTIKLDIRFNKRDILSYVSSNDGEHWASVSYYNSNTGYSKTYKLKVEVEENKLVCVYFKNGYLDESHFTPPEIINGEASFEDDRGREFDITLLEDASVKVNTGVKVNTYSNSYEDYDTAETEIDYESEEED